MEYTLLFAIYIAVTGVGGGFCLGYTYSQFNLMKQRIRKLEATKEAE